MYQSGQAYQSLVNSHMLLSESDDRFFKQYRLGKTRYYALWHIQQQPGLSLSDLSRHLLCTKGNTTRIVRSLAEAGLLARQADAEDGRTQRLELTAKGRKQLFTATQAYQAHQQALFACLTDEQLHALVGSLETLNAHLGRQLRPGQAR